MISSIYIPHVENYITADYIADVLNKSKIATVKRIALQPYKKNKSERLYQKAFVDIHEWHDTENAYNFIQKLQKTSMETRLIHATDRWWIVKINEYPHKTKKSTPNRSLNIYVEEDMSSCCDISITSSMEEDIDDFNGYMREAYQNIFKNQENNEMEEIYEGLLSNSEDTPRAFNWTLPPDLNWNIPLNYDWDVVKETIDWDTLNECLLFA